MQNYILLALLIALNVGDILATLAVLRKGGVERNPVARFVMDRIGALPGALLLKGVATLLAIAVVLFAPAYGLVLVPLCALAGFAILRNLDSL